MHKKTSGQEIRDAIVRLLEAGTESVTMVAIAVEVWGKKSRGRATSLWPFLAEWDQKGYIVHTHLIKSHPVSKGKNWEEFKARSFITPTKAAKEGMDVAPQLISGIKEWATALHSMQQNSYGAGYRAGQKSTSSEEQQSRIEFLERENMDLNEEVTKLRAQLPKKEGSVFSKIFGQTV